MFELVGESCSLGLMADVASAPQTRKRFHRKELLITIVALQISFFLITKITCKAFIKLGNAVATAK